MMKARTSSTLTFSTSASAAASVNSLASPCSGALLPTSASPDPMAIMQAEA